MKASNVYFFVIMIMQMIPEISISGGQPAMAPPLTFVVIVSMIKDAYEDIMRHVEDAKENGEKASKYNKATGQYEKCKWKDIHIGDFVLVKDNEFFPADLLMMSSTEPEGICCVETKNLDGETNLKNKMALAATNDLFSPETSLPVDRLPEGTMNVEYPNNRIYKFDGNFILNSEKNSNAL